MTGVQTCALPIYQVSRRYALISTLNAKLLGFEYVKELYVNDDDFASVFGACERQRLVSSID